MKLRAIPYELGHLDRFEIKKIHEGEGIQLADRVNAIVRSSHTYSCTAIADDGEPIAVLGLTQIAPGVGEFWSVTGTRVKDYPKSFAKLVKHMIGEYSKNLRLHRAQIVIRSNNPELCRWVKFLGFEHEGVLRKYGPDQADYIMCARMV